MILEAETFRSFEHTGWQEIPVGYHEAFGSLTTQAIEPLLDAVRLKKDMSFLDIASGPGYVAAAAAKRGATVLGVDFSTAMVAQAQNLYAGVEFREGDAEKLSVGNNLFDAAAMNFGILHLGQPELALPEAQRILRSSGRFAFSVWAKPEETIGFGLSCAPLSCTANRASNCPKDRRFFVTAIRTNAPAACSSQALSRRASQKCRRLGACPRGMAFSMR
jgi:SAM-dependent methyltransferase